MALFGKLFERKVCGICGEEIKLLGNRKLEDGNMCKTCSEKLSPWFDDRRNSTVAQIKEQIDYREENKEKVAAFRTTRTLGEGMKILLDEDAGRFMVTSARDLQKVNPDVLEFSDVTGCLVEVEEDKTELMKEGKDGEEISYKPPRYTYDYRFHITIQVRNPYFDEISSQINDTSVELENVIGVANPARSAEYRKYKQMSEDMKDAILQVRKQAREEEIAAATPKKLVSCPYCGAQTVPDEKGCCECCRGLIN